MDNAVCFGQKYQSTVDYSFPGATANWMARPFRLPLRRARSRFCSILVLAGAELPRNTSLTDPPSGQLPAHAVVVSHTLSIQASATVI